MTFPPPRNSISLSGAMKIRVECYAGHRGDETPRRIVFDARAVEVAEVIDRWLGADHRYFKVLGADQATYILRQDMPTLSWELTMYERPTAAGERRS
ncbi:MAG: hypothetical protein OEM59_09060 [Rhodospirillales bacterium]|nr:hypothetical protein [Rhodospirillales bacterium]